MVVVLHLHRASLRFGSAQDAARGLRMLHSSQHLSLHRPIPLSRSMGSSSIPAAAMAGRSASVRSSSALPRFSRGQTIPAFSQGRSAVFSTAATSSNGSHAGTFFNVFNLVDRHLHAPPSVVLCRGTGQYICSVLSPSIHGLCNCIFNIICIHHGNT